MDDNKPEYPMVAVLAFDWCGPDNALEHFDEDGVNNINPLHGWVSGFLVSEDKKCVRIAQQHFTNGLFRSIICIPKKTIIKRIDIENDMS